MSVDNVQCPTPSNVSRFPRSLSPVNKSVQFTRTLKALKKSQFEKSTTSMINQCDQLNIFQFLISKKASFCVSHILIFYKSGEFNRSFKSFNDTLLLFCFVLFCSVLFCSLDGNLQTLLHIDHTVSRGRVDA